MRKILAIPLILLAINCSAQYKIQSPLKVYGYLELNNYSTLPSGSEMQIARYHDTIWVYHGGWELLFPFGPLNQWVTDSTIHLSYDFLEDPNLFDVDISPYGNPHFNNIWFSQNENSEFQFMYDTTQFYWYVEDYSNNPVFELLLDENRFLVNFKGDTILHGDTTSIHISNADSAEWKATSVVTKDWVEKRLSNVTYSGDTLQAKVLKAEEKIILEDNYITPLLFSFNFISNYGGPISDTITMNLGNLGSGFSSALHNQAMYFTSNGIDFMVDDGPTPKLKIKEDTIIINNILKYNRRPVTDTFALVLYPDETIDTASFVNQSKWALHGVKPFIFFFLKRHNGELQWERFKGDPYFMISNDPGKRASQFQIIIEKLVIYIFRIWVVLILIIGFLVYQQRQIIRLKRKN